MTLPPQEPPITYTGGPWLAIVVDDLAVLAGASATDERLLSAAWSAAVGGQGLDAVLAVLAQSAGDLAAVARTAEATRVVVTGAGRADVGGTVVAADGGRRDERLAGRVPVRLLAPGADAGNPLPLMRGMATAGAVGIGTTAAAAGSAVPAAPEAAASEPAASEPAAAPAEAGAPGAGAAEAASAQSATATPRPVDPVPVPRVSTDTMPPSSVYDSGIIESLPWRGTQDIPTAAQPSAAPAAPPPPPPPSEPPSQPDPYANPFGAPAASHPQNPWAAPPAPPAPAWQPPPAPSTPPAPSAPPAYAAPPAPPANPWAPGGAPGPSTPSGPVPVVSEDASGPVVQAFTCPRGHLNPPYAGTCRLCGEAIAPQEGFTVPRPPLGVLKLSTGDTVPLDRDVVLGRAPFHADENAASRPHLVQLASPGNDISRSHVRVNLENWFVQVTDLGSTNGTVVTLPDQAPVRLRPHDPFTIVPGTTVNIADEVTLRFDIS